MTSLIQRFTDKYPMANVAATTAVGAAIAEPISNAIILPISRKLLSDFTEKYTVLTSIMSVGAGILGCTLVKPSPDKSLQLSLKDFFDPLAHLERYTPRSDIALAKRIHPCTTMKTAGALIKRVGLCWNILGSISSVFSTMARVDSFVISTIGLAMILAGEKLEQSYEQKIVKYLVSGKFHEAKAANAKLDTYIALIMGQIQKRETQTVQPEVKKPTRWFYRC